MFETNSINILLPKDTKFFAGLFYNIIYFFIIFINVFIDGIIEKNFNLAL